jgi:hypothetical protein
MSAEWIRPTESVMARKAMIEAEKRRDYESAALLAVALSDMSSGFPEDSAAYGQQAQVFALLHQAQTALFIAEHRQPFQLPDYQS